MLNNKTKKAVRSATLFATLSATLFAATTLPALAHEGEVHCEDTVLGGIMKEMNDDLKSYVAAFKRNDPAAMQAQVTKLLANTTKAKNEVPVKLKQKQSEMPAMDHSQMANMPGMDHDMPAMDHSQMANMPGMDHQTHMQHQGYQQGIEKLTHLLNQLQTANGKTEVKTVLNAIKQHTKKSHRKYQLECE
jgi:hypothetical protein